MSVRTKYPVRFSAKNMVSHLGGTLAAYGIIREMGGDITFRTVEQWVYRDDIPSEAVATFTLWAARSGEVFPVHLFLMEREDAEA